MLGCRHSVSDAPMPDLQGDSGGSVHKTKLELLFRGQQKPKNKLAETMYSLRSARRVRFDFEITPVLSRPKDAVAWGMLHMYYHRELQLNKDHHSYHNMLFKIHTQTLSHGSIISQTKRHDTPRHSPKSV